MMRSSLRRLVVNSLDGYRALDLEESLADGAIVIGRDYGALGVVRSLGRRGVDVLLLEEATSNASVSRFTRARQGWPADEAAQLELLRGLARREHRDWTIFPASDESAALIARHHDELGRSFRLTTPSWNTLRWAYDKRLTHEIADRAGVPSPRTIVPVDREDLLARNWRFPVIIKPAIKPETNALTAAKAWRVDNLDELTARYEEACLLVDPATILVQELVPGGGAGQLSFAALCVEGVPVASITARRVRQFPVDFGKYSTHVESIDAPEIEELSRRFLAATGFSGVIELEYKRDPRTSEPKLLDANGRIWAWHTLGARAGTDFPWLQWQLAHGVEIGEWRARAGVRWVRGLTDVPAALRLIRAGAIPPWALPAAYIPPVEFAIWAWDDPLPALLDAPLMARRARSRRATSSIGRIRAAIGPLEPLGS